jgi:nitrous oxidase accessory protein NosD
MNVLSLTQRRISAKMFAGITMVSLLLSAFPAAFFVAEAAVAPTSGITMEVVVNPVGSDPDLEYIKITNDGPDTLSLVDFKLDEGGTELPFIGGTVLSGDSFLICANGTFADNGGKSCYATFPTGFDLVNTGGTVTLYGESNTELISVTWGDVSGTESDSATASDSFTPAPVACTPQIEDGLPTGPVQNTDTTQFFTTIQNAIDDCDTDAGDTIVVQSGSHVEAPQVVVGKNITLLGQGINDTTINSDADTGTTGDARSWFFVETGVEFNVKDLTFDGVGHKISEGIRHGGAGTIDTVRFKDIGYFNNGTDGKPYRGTALRAHGDGPVHVKNSEFENIGRIGVLFRGSGVAGSTFTDNTYTGKGDGDWLDYALDISAGAEVTVTGNTISNNTGEATVDGSTSAGILVSTYFGAGTEAVIENNNLLDNTLGIAVGYTAADTSDVQVAQNNITGNTEYGILALENTRVTATENWWGDATGPDGEGLGTGDKVSEHVGFEPWLCGPFADSPDSSEGGVCKAPEPDTTLRVCKIIRDTNGAIIDGSTVAGTEFSVDIAGPGNFNQTVTFTTPLVANTDLVNDNGAALDAYCEVIELDKTGQYTYSEENIVNGNALWAAPLYHDFFTEIPTEIADFAEFTIDESNTDNDDTDGVINIGKNKQRTLAMVNTIESMPSVTVSASKIVCEYEGELPNWGDVGSGPTGITGATAADWLVQNEAENPFTTCRAVPEWEFEWSDNSVGVPNSGGDNYNTFIGPATGWNTFTGSTVVPMSVLNGGNLEFREVLQAGYVQFGQANGYGVNKNIGAEFYCGNDVVGYDNLERINKPVEDETYHCVGFNAEKLGELPPMVGITAAKIVCDYESELPNWASASDAPSVVTGTTATDWLAQNLIDNPNTTCRAVPEWEFEWSDKSVTAPSQYNSYVGPAAGWNTFTGSTVVPMSTLDGGNLEFREVLLADYIKFAGGSNNVSAELYCATDLINYDNLERVLKPVEGETYHCVAWNAPTVPPACTLDIYSDEMTLVKETNETAKATYDGNGRWTANIANAIWVWVTDRVSDPENYETQTFVETFTVANPTAGNIAIAHDNWLKLTINNTVIERNQNGYQDFQKYDEDILAALVSGENRIEMEVKNIGTNRSNYRSNPAGALFHIAVEGDADSCVRTTEPEPVAEMCHLPYLVTFDVDSDEVTYSTTTATGLVIEEITNGYTIGLYDDGRTGIYNVSGTITFPVGTDTSSFTFSEAAADNGLEQSHLLYPDVADRIGNEITFDLFVNGADDIFSIVEPSLETTANCSVPTPTLVDPGPSDDDTVTISGTKYNASTTLGIPNWEIVATNDMLDTSTTTMTGDSGKYSFTLPDEGLWVISEVPQPNWSQVKVVENGVNRFPGDNPAVCRFGDLGIVPTGGDELFTFAESQDSEDGYSEGLSCDFYNEPIVSDVPDVITPDPTLADDDTQRTSSRSSQSGQRFPDRFGFATPAATPQVLGATTANFCPFLEDFMQMGESNDSMEVMKLQIFLNIFKGMFGGTENPVTGTFGTTTDANVKAFQQQFQTEILDPWYNQSIVPHNRPTGFVYKTTLWKINSIVCPDYAGQLSFEGEDLTKNVNTSQDF